MDELGKEQTPTYHKPLISQLSFEIELDWKHVDVVSGVWIFG